MAARGLKKDFVWYAVRRVFLQLNKVLLAIKEHHHWVHSPRARVLEEWTVRASVLLHYVAYLLFVWLAYQLWNGFVQLVAKTSPTGLLSAKDALDFRSSLFYVFAGAFLIPAGLFVMWFVAKWTYRLIEAVAYRRLPRFMRLPFYPAVLCGVALVGLGYKQPLAVMLARSYVEARAVVVVARQPGAGLSEQMQAGSPSPTSPAPTQTEALIEKLREHHPDRNGQPPPEPLELERDSTATSR